MSGPPASLAAPGRRLRAGLALLALSAVGAACTEPKEPISLDPLIRPTSTPVTGGEGPFGSGPVSSGPSGSVGGTASPSTTSTTSTTVVNTTANPFPDNFDDAQLSSLCGGPCHEDISVGYEHRTLGPGRVAWLSTPGGSSLGAYFLVGPEASDARWGRAVTDGGARLVDASVDGLGHLFFQLRLGSGKVMVVVLVPTGTGFTDLTTLNASSSPWVCDAAAITDIGGQDAVSITVGSATYRYQWDGRTYTVVR